MKIDILTIFPKMFKGPFDESIIKKAQERSLVEIKVHNLRKWTSDKHKTVDDRPFGGGTGMILKPEPVFEAVEALLKGEVKGVKKILLTPQGSLLTQEMTHGLAEQDHLILVCGHYEGMDERIREYLVDEEISIGDYVLTGGELPAMVLVDGVVRLVPGVLKKDEATIYESFQKLKVGGKTKRLLEYPQYTRPANFRGHKVPQVLLSGNHKEIHEWRLRQAVVKTKKRRPDLLSSDS